MVPSTTDAWRGDRLLSDASVPSCGDVVPSLVDGVVDPPGSWQRCAQDDFDKSLLSRFVSGKNGNENVRKAGTRKCECKKSVALVHGVYLLSSLVEGGKKTRQTVTIGSTGKNGVIQKHDVFVGFKDAII